jgi:hypothetical protein
VPALIVPVKSNVAESKWLPLVDDIKGKVMLPNEERFYYTASLVFNKHFDIFFPEGIVHCANDIVGWSL